jgi:NTP pyrophosphatase (non-canonical NTP hydrolase)
MNFDEYQKKSRELAIYPDRGKNFVYPGFGLVGEAGEVAEKLKRIIRDQNWQVTEENRQELAKELGDVLWYVANLAAEFKLPLSKIAEMNIEKLTSRHKRGTLKGSGDNR